MDELRQSIMLQAYAQKDPLVEFKRSSFQMFDHLKDNITREVVYQIIPQSFAYERYLRQIEAEQQARLATAREAGGSSEMENVAAKPQRKSVALPGRNDRCPCGSGKKFKDCHLGKEEEIMHLLGAQAARPPVTRTVVTVPAHGRPAENPTIAAEAEKIRQAAAGQPKPQEAPRGKAAPPAVPRGKKK